MMAQFGWGEDSNIDSEEDRGMRSLGPTIVCKEESAMRESAAEVDYSEITILGKPALFSEWRIDRSLLQNLT